MDGATTEGAAFDETVVFLSYFNDLQDPRQPGKVTYPLDEILLLCLLAVPAGAESFTDRSLRRQEARVSSPLPPVQRRHAGTRSSGRYPGRSGCRAVPALLRWLGR